MRAFVQTRYGGPEAMELRDVAEPVARAGEVLVRVAAAGLNPVDFKTRRGDMKPIQRHSLPIVAGSELAGTVEATGPGVTRFSPGDRVFARVALATLGAFAEKAVVREELLAAMPSSLGFEG